MEDTDPMAVLGATDVRKVMKSQGPVVTTVILRCTPSSSTIDAAHEEDSKPAALVESKEQEQEQPESQSESQSESQAEAQEHSRSMPEETSNENGEKVASTPRVVLTDSIEEAKIDTTPSKSKVAEMLGGPFTFLGQYEDEGIVLMVRNFPDDLEADLKDIYENSEEENENGNENENEGAFSFSEQLSKNFNTKALKAVCFQRDIDTEAMTEKRELVEALVEYQKRLPPFNPHKLQPPLHKARVRGDIIVMKVAETPEELDDDDGEVDNQKSDTHDGASKNLDSNSNSNSNDAPDDALDDAPDDAPDDAGEAKEKSIQSNDSSNKKEAIKMPSNDEFFLDYSKEAYIKFASRTDIPEHEIELEERDEEDGEENETGENGESTIIGVGDGDNDDEDDDEDDNDDHDREQIDENDKSAMFNLVMNELLRQYREENGRGPNTKELLELRSNIARELGVEIAHEIDGDWDKMAKENQVPSAKKIAFTKEADRVRHYVPDANEYPSDRDDEDDEDEEDDEDYDDEYSDDAAVARLLEDEYDRTDGEKSDHPPRKRLKISEDEKDGGDSKPAATST